MRISRFSSSSQLIFLCVLSLTIIWAPAFFEVFRAYQASIHEAEVKTQIQAHVFAEFSRSTFKRVNEFIVEARHNWATDPKRFSEFVKRSQENIGDISFQVAIIDKDGMLSFSNLDPRASRIDLSQREHFRVHKESNGTDRLFVSRPLIGKVSKQLSIQLTRPIFRDGQFDGVIVVSMDPTQLTAFGITLSIGAGGALTVVRDSGEIVSRMPPNPVGAEPTLSSRPFLAASALNFGNYRAASLVDGTERIWGYYRLPEYGLTFVQGERIDEVLSDFTAFRLKVIGWTLTLSGATLFLFFALFRNLVISEDTKRQLDETLLLSPAGFVTFDNQLHLKYTNTTFTNLTGLRQSELLGIDRGAFLSRLEDICTGAAKPTFAALANTPPIQPNSSTRYLIELSRPPRRVLEVGIRKSEVGSVREMLYFRDVTNEVEVDRLKGEFLSTAAHELRTPMASIYGFAEILLTQDMDEKSRHEGLEIIYHQSEAMISILNELLDLARIEARRGMDFVFTTENLVDAVRSTLAATTGMGNHPIPFVNPPRDASLLVRADPAKLRQAINNVLSNAYKYSPENSTISIDFATKTIGDQLMAGVSISDQGIGMTPEQISRVFERFYRADTSGKVPGTGLGMSIVKEIIDIHQGMVDIQSSLGHGTTVTIWVPIQRSPSDTHTQH